MIRGEPVHIKDGEVDPGRRLYHYFALFWAQPVRVFLKAERFCDLPGKECPEFIFHKIEIAAAYHHHWHGLSVVMISPGTKMFRSASGREVGREQDPGYRRLQHLPVRTLRHNLSLTNLHSWRYSQCTGTGGYPAGTRKKTRPVRLYRGRPRKNPPSSSATGLCYVSRKEKFLPVLYP